MPSILLVLETSGPSLGVALNIDGRTVFAEDVEAGSIHGKALAPQIQKALTEQALTPEALAAVAVSIGPGSWTGLRIGLSAAKAMAWALNIPLVPVPSFDALALRARAQHPDAAAILCLRDARSEGCFAALFCETDGRLQRSIKECVLPAAEVLAAVAAAGLENPDGVVLCGDPAPVKAVQALALQRGWNWTGAALQTVRAADLAVCAQARFDAGELLRGSAAIHAAAPMYLRRSDPELKLERKT